VGDKIKLANKTLGYPTSHISISSIPHYVPRRSPAAVRAWGLVLQSTGRGVREMEMEARMIRFLLLVRLRVQFLLRLLLLSLLPQQ